MAPPPAPPAYQQPQQQYQAPPPPVPQRPVQMAMPAGTFPVLVPAGHGPGMQLMVRAPNTGQMMTVIIPQGVGPGGQFAVPLPQPPRVQYGAPQRTGARPCTDRGAFDRRGHRRLRPIPPPPRRPSFCPAPPSLPPTTANLLGVFDFRCLPGVRTAAESAPARRRRALWRCRMDACACEA